MKILKQKFLIKSLFLLNPYKFYYYEELFIKLDYFIILTMTKRILIQLINIFMRKYCEKTKKNTETAEGAASSIKVPKSKELDSNSKPKGHFWARSASVSLMKLNLTILTKLLFGILEAS